MHYKINKYKIIFLDVDGVLNNHQFLSQNAMLEPERQRLIDPEKVQILKRIVDQTKAKIVLSSSWRSEFINGLTPESEAARQLLNVLSDFNLHIWDKTDAVSKKEDSIVSWLNINKHLIDTSVVIDDDFLEVSPSVLVRCSFYVGLTDQIADDVIRRLMDVNGTDG